MQILEKKYFNRKKKQNFNYSFFYFYSKIYGYGACVLI